MSRHYQDSEIEFRKTVSENTKYPESRGIVVYQYGGTIEEKIAEARKTFSLGEEWEVIKCEEELE